MPQMGSNGSKRSNVVRVCEAGEALIGVDSNAHESVSCRDKHGDIESPWVKTGAGGVSPLSFAYFSLRRAPKEVPLGEQRKVDAAPHRGNADKPTRNRGCQQKPKQTASTTTAQQKPITATASQTKTTFKTSGHATSSSHPIATETPTAPTVQQASASRAC